MTTDTRTVHTTTTAGQPPRAGGWTPRRKIALAGGIAYLVTFAASIPQLKLFADVIADPTGYISNPGSNAAVQWGSVLEFLTAASGVATAVILYPVTRRVSRTAAIGFVTSRVVEAALILVGVVSILSVVTLQQHFAGATGAQAAGARRHRGVPGRDAAVDVPARAGRHGRRERPAPGLHPLPVRAGGPRHPDHRPRRRPPHPRVGHRDDPRRSGARPPRPASCSASPSPCSSSPSAST